MALLVCLVSFCSVLVLGDTVAFLVYNVSCVRNGSGCRQNFSVALLLCSLIYEQVLCCR